MHTNWQVCSLVVQAKSERISDISTQLNAFPGCEVAVSDAPSGQLIVVVEAEEDVYKRQGLYQPQSGEILLDGKPVSGEQPEDYRKLFSAVFTDVWLFDQLLGPEGKPANPQLVEKWLAQLKMAHKLELSNGRIVNLKLSKGQKKRVALLLALAEERDIILLDEWAADQDPHFRREFYQVLLPCLLYTSRCV